MHAAHDHAGSAGRKLVCKRMGQADRSGRRLLEAQARKAIRVASKQPSHQILGIRGRCHACFVEHIGQKVARHGREQKTSAESVAQRLQIGRIPRGQDVSDKQASLQSAHRVRPRPQQLPKRGDPPSGRRDLNAKTAASPRQCATACLALFERRGEQLDAPMRGHRPAYGR